MKGKCYKTIFKQPDVPTTRGAHIIQKFQIHWTAANLAGCGSRRRTDDKLKKRLIQITIKEPRKTSKEI